MSYLFCLLLLCSILFYSILYSILRSISCNYQFRSRTTSLHFFFDVFGKPKLISKCTTSTFIVTALLPSLPRFFLSSLPHTSLQYPHSYLPSNSLASPLLSHCCSSDLPPSLPNGPCYAVLFSLYCTTLHCTVLYCTVLYCTVLCVIYCIVMLCTVLYCTRLLCCFTVP
jgi:hypothetical protein